MAEIVLVVAVARNGVIGVENRMPWHISGDLKRFRRITMGHPVIMGRKTFESIGKPLPGRHNIVLTRDSGWQAEGATAVPDWDTALAAAGDVPAIMVIGGGEIFRQAMPLATRIEWTQVELTPAGDATMPEPDGESWQEVAREPVAADGDTPAHSFITLVRRNGLQPGSPKG